MDPRMRDELFWNRRIRDAVVRTGQARGLQIRSYEPDQLTIANENDPRTNWSVGRRHHDAGAMPWRSISMPTAAMAWDQA